MEEEEEEEGVDGSRVTVAASGGGLRCPGSLLQRSERSVGGVTAKARRRCVRKKIFMHRRSLGFFFMDSGTSDHDWIIIAPHLNVSTLL